MSVTTREGAADALHRIAGKQRTFTSWFLVLLTWLLLASNLWLLFWEPTSHEWHDGLRYADCGLSGFLALSICWRWLRFRIGRRYLRSRLWEIPALVPLAVPGFSEAHWVMWLVLIARVVRVVDRTDNYFGDTITAALVTHFSDPIVEAVRKPITIAVLDEVIDVIKVGDYAGNVRAALDENRAELEAMILELVKKDQTTGKLRHLPFHDDLVMLISDTVLRIVEAALEDPRTAELISDAIRNSASQIRAAIHE
ncbi:ion transporter [Nocardioides sp. Kera G14]|uniref:ion transporter n=1 Tax=Nocardioides sp. Kera G14 TaxID=2884264 RepID=UPI001D12AAE8|nr:ion transporter [Nocardioides sp. Kera G14]UDY24849.1 ion transporter [Nocardioides sp. Kera G14]